MSRPSSLWYRKGRGFFTTLQGRQIALGNEKRQAKAKLAVLLAQAKPVLPGQFTVAQLVQLFLAECDRKVDRQELSRETVKTHRAYLLRWAEACRRLKPEHLRAYHLKAWADSHESWNPTTAASAIGRVKLWSAWCESTGYLDFDRLRSTRAPQRLTREAADPADLMKLERSIECPRFRDWFQVLYDTGCRPGELKGIKASDVDWERSTAIVVGKRGERIVGLTERALSILKRCALTWPTGSLLRTPRLAEWSQSAIKYHFRMHQAKAGIPRTVTPYSCRHDLYRRWNAAGVTDLTVAAQLGHRSLNLPHLGLLASTYAHVSAAPLAAAARSAELAGSREGKSSKHRKRQG